MKAEQEKKTSWGPQKMTDQILNKFVGDIKIAQRGLM